MKAQRWLLRKPLLLVSTGSLRLQHLLLPHLLFLVLLPQGTSATLRCWNGGSNSIGMTSAFVGPALTSNSRTTCSSGGTCLCSRGRFMLHPRLRVRRLSRDSGSSHVLELARQRLLLHREGSVEKYMQSPIMPFPVEGEIHSQRKRSKAPPPQGLPSGPLLLQRQAKLLLRRHRGTRNNRRVLLLRDRLLALLQQQEQLLSDSPEPTLAFLQKLWDLDTSQKQQCQQQRQQQCFQQQHQQHQKETAWLQQRLTRPLGSKYLFICGVDLRAAATDVESLFQTITQYPVYARLKRSKEGRHLGFGILEFGSTLDATRCLLQLNGIKIGNSVIHLGEALGSPRDSQKQELQHQEDQGSGEQGGKKPRYIHPYPLPCE